MNLEDIIKNYDKFSKKDKDLEKRKYIEDFYDLSKNKYIEAIDDKIESKLIKNKYEENLYKINYKNDSLEDKIKDIYGKEDLYNVMDKNYNKKKLEEYTPKNFYKGLDNIVDNYLSNGYKIKEKYSDSIREYDFFKEKPAKKRKAEVKTAEKTKLPEEYKSILGMLSEKHPGIEYAGMVRLEDKSQHNVDILTFQYMEQGQLRTMHVVVKDKDEKDEKIPLFLKQLGINTHSVYDRNTRLLMEHVGEQELRHIIQQGSESEILKACGKALDKISQIHVLATQNLSELKDKYGLMLQTTDYNAQFKNRFIKPVSKNSLVISPQLGQLMQAYSYFTGFFDPRYFTHGDFHPGNCRMTADECFVLDYEWAKIGRKFDDVSRFTNAVLRDRPDFNEDEFAREMLTKYVNSHNEYSQKELMINNRIMSAMKYSLINDELYKVGEYITFAEQHPRVAEEKLQKSTKCFERAIGLMDGAIEIATNNSEQYILSNLRQSLINYASTTKYLQETAKKYESNSQPLIILKAA